MPLLIYCSCGECVDAHCAHYFNTSFLTLARSSSCAVQVTYTPHFRLRSLFLASYITMKTFTILPVLYSCIRTVAAWTTTNHWQTSVATGNPITTTTSIAIYPTGAVSATSTNTSTSLFTSGGYKLALTVFDLFYEPNVAVCTRSRLSPCGPTPNLSRTSDSITTTYWAPVLIANPTSCTKTSFAYTTASTVVLPSLWILDAAQQATQSVQALVVTTYISTLSTNLGGQAVTTTVCDVYLRGDAVLGVPYVAESIILTECVDPRDYRCRQLSSAIAAGAGITGNPTCDRTEQAYPPTAVAGAINPTKSSGASCFSPVALSVSMAVSAFAALLGLTL